MIEPYLRALKKCELFESIDIDELRLLLRCLKPRIQDYERGDFVVISGDKLDSIGIVLEGRASVFKESLSGNRQFIKNLGIGEMFGEIAAFARQKVWPALVQANTSMTVCFIPQNKITGQCESLCTWHEKLVTNMLGVVAERAILLSKKMEFISIKTMRAKLCTYFYEQYIKKGSATLVLPLNRGQLADFLNVSRPSMSREMAKMKAEGLIDYHMSTIKILDIEALKSYCE